MKIFPIIFISLGNKYYDYKRLLYQQNFLCYKWKDCRGLSFQNASILTEASPANLLHCAEDLRVSAIGNHFLNTCTLPSHILYSLVSDSRITETNKSTSKDGLEVPSDQDESITGIDMVIKNMNANTAEAETAIIKSKIATTIKIALEVAFKIIERIRIAKIKITLLLGKGSNNFIKDESDDTIIITTFDAFKITIVVMRNLNTGDKNERMSPRNSGNSKEAIGVQGSTELGDLKVRMIV